MLLVRMAYRLLYIILMDNHTQIVQYYLIEHGADVYALESNGRAPQPEFRKSSKQKDLFQVAFSIEHCYYMKLVNL